jgi:hypothetical protein
MMIPQKQSWTKPSIIERISNMGKTKQLMAFIRQWREIAQDIEEGGVITEPETVVNEMCDGLLNLIRASNPDDTLDDTQGNAIGTTETEY